METFSFIYSTIITVLIIIFDYQTYAIKSEALDGRFDFYSRFELLIRGRNTRANEEVCALKMARDESFNERSCYASFNQDFLGFVGPLCSIKKIFM